MTDVLALFTEDEEEKTITYDTVRTLSDAENMVGRIAVAESNIKRYIAAAEWIKNKAAVLIAKEEERIKKAHDSLEPYCKEIIENNIKLDPKSKKSLDFMFGKAGYRIGRDSIEVEDEGVALDSCHSLGIYTRTKESIDKIIVMKFIKEKGHIPEGMKVIQAEEKFYVKTE